MNPNGGENASWRTHLKIAVWWSIPIWVVLIVETILEPKGLAIGADIALLPGFALMIIVSFGRLAIHDLSLITLCIFNCIFYFGAVWLIVKLYYRFRKRKQLSGEL